jgi:hypothetical protein
MANALMGLFIGIVCEYYEVFEDPRYDYRTQYHSPSCQRCRYISNAADVQITVHEWPLPGNNTLSFLFLLVQSLA